MFIHYRAHFPLLLVFRGILFGEMAERRWICIMVRLLDQFAISSLLIWPEESIGAIQYTCRPTSCIDLNIARIDLPSGMLFIEYLNSFILVIRLASYYTFVACVFFHADHWKFRKYFELFNIFGAINIYTFQIIANIFLSSRNAILILRKMKVEEYFPYPDNYVSEIFISEGDIASS